MKEATQALGLGKPPAKHNTGGRVVLSLLAGLIVLAAAGSAWADDDHGKHWNKHHDRGSGHYHDNHPAYIYARPPAYVVAPPPRVIYVRPKPVYVQPVPVYPQPTLSVVVPLHID